MKRVITIIALIGFLGIAGCNDDMNEITINNELTIPDQVAGDGDEEENDKPPIGGGN